MTDRNDAGIDPARSLPPPTVDEPAWDILLALNAERDRELGLDKLACLVSVPALTFYQSLASLERRRLVKGTKHRFTRQLRAVLTPAGCELLGRYVSACSDLRLGAHH